MLRTTVLKPKPGKCRHCKSRLQDGEASLHQDCVSPWFEANKEKLRAKAKRVDAKAKRVEKAQDKVKREKLKTLSQLEGECRRIVQAIARIRDRNDGCISCHLPSTWGGQWHGSHYRPAGNHSAVELHLWNIHKSCSACNRHKGGNIAGYTPRIIAKMGQWRVDWLMAQNQTVKRTREYLQRFKKVMGKRLRRMEKRMEKES